MVSISTELSLVENGYSFFPSGISFFSYRYLFADAEKLIRAYGITIAVCVVGGALNVLMTTLYAYPISRSSFKYRNFFSFYIFFTMLFSGGLVPTYIMYASYFKLINNPIMLAVPGLLSAFNVLIVRTFYRLNISDSILESAKMDGAGEGMIFFRIVLPLSTPAVATIGLFSVLMYWNDWYSCLLYINEAKYYNLQYAMYQALRTIEYLTSSSASMNMANLSGELLKVPAESLRMAMAIIGIGPIVFAYPFFQRYFIKGLTLGAVKE
ncbi:MAG: carbohydrate ABC transporter permease [Clostridiales bacterium]|jgi:putative aldouronate transport system permease protein|nr:carbohydrate ABC transporter permease [Clostridiales bacterium]